MDTSNGAAGGVPDEPGDDSAIGVPEPDLQEVEWQKPGAGRGRYDEYDDNEDDEYEQFARQEEEPLRRQLAQFAFVREEDDREVRLSFRDVPANEIAKSFRGSGALLISVTGERAASPPAMAARTSPNASGEDVASEGTPVPRSRRRRRRGSQGAQTPDDPLIPPLRPHRPTGELTMRYFFSLRETVYTVNITTPTGIVESIASIYPSAAQSEREIQSRLAVLFRENRN
jgi:hypothetical protein